jgi:hypothetical protein
VHNQVRVEVNRKWKAIKKTGVSVFLATQLPVRLSLRRFQIDILAVPLTAQLQIMIADHGRKPRVGHEELEHFAALRTLRDQVSHGNNPVVLSQINLFDQSHQLVITTVNVSHYNRPTRHPALRSIIYRELAAVYCIAKIQSTPQFFML